MNMYFDTSSATTYKNNSQIIRVLSEKWVTNNVFCPCCGNDRITKLNNNMPVADMYCNNCNEIFELKSKQGNIGKKIIDGAYSTMIERINSTTNPELLVLQYTDDLRVSDLTLVPKFFFVPSIIEKRKPLSKHARRAGWVGCNILYNEIPAQGKIPIIKDGAMFDKREIVSRYTKVKNIQTNDMISRGWTLDILNCINNIQTDVFMLRDVYFYADNLNRLHPDNNNVKAKIRQQLQILRDKGFIEFVDRGIYRKVI